MPLKLISNKGKPFEDSIGKVNYTSGKIQIDLKPHCQVSLTREGKIIKLLETTTSESFISGIPKEGDVYTLGKTESIIQGRDEDLLIITFKKVDLLSKLPSFSKFPKFQKQRFVVRDNSDNEKTPQARNTTLTVGVILLILLLLSVVFGIKQKKLKEFNSKSEVILTQALTNYQDSIDASSLDKEKSREYFILAKEAAEKLKSDGFKNDSLDKLISDINSKEGEVLGEIKVDVKEFLDLTLQTSGFSGDELVSSGEDIFVIDKTNKNIIKVGVKTKSAEVFAGQSEVDGTIQLSAYEERLFLLKDDGVYEVDNKAEKVIDKDWEESLIYSYAGNIYLIDKTNNTILRYAGTQGGFTEKSDWLAPGIEADFSKVKDVSIDGAIWLLSSSGKVSKFTLGSPQSIQLKGLIGQLDDPTAIYTNEELEMVYILEKDKGRIVVLEKNGDFKVQYTSDDIKNAKDLVVSEEEEKIILLTGSKLTYIELK